MFAAQLHEFLLQCPQHTGIYVGYSGGVDSHVLLDVLCGMQQPVKAIHINHQLSPHALQWEEHCQKVCADYRIPLFIERTNIVMQPGMSLEAAARAGRYEAYQTWLPEHALLLLAHHQNDQAETLLFNLLRGSGLPGLAAMPPIKSDKKLWIGRPFLNVSRDVIEAYAREKKLVWVTDESNANQNYARNYLRHTVLPVLEQRWPSAAQTIARSAHWMADALALQLEIAAEDLKACQNQQGTAVSLEIIKTLSLVRQQNVLRYFIKQKTGFYPSASLLQQILQQALGARLDAQVLIAFEKMEIRRYHGFLYCIPALLPFHSEERIPWDLRTTLVLPTGQVLEGDTSLQHVPSEAAEHFICFRPAGLKFLWKGHHRVLKKIFQQLAIPAWERGRVPLLFKNNHLVGIFYLRKWHLSS